MRFLIPFLLIGVVAAEPLEFSLDSDELRGSMEWPSLQDRDTADNLGIFMSDFFGDSKSQVIYILGLVTQHLGYT
jgi:hypothetical protein